jgi:hypothetical protein
MQVRVHRGTKPTLIGVDKTHFIQSENRRKSLADLLKRWLRKTAVIGRIGREFSQRVGLPTTLVCRRRDHWVASAGYLKSTAT